jgi:hypothetical protein
MASSRMQSMKSNGPHGAATYTAVVGDLDPTFESIV